MINLARLYLKCAHMHRDARNLTMMADEKRLPKKLRESLVKAQEKQMQLSEDFLIVAGNLYRLAGRELTLEEMEKRKLNAAETKAFAEELVRIVDEQTFVHGHPSTLYGQCARNMMGEEIRDPPKLDIRLNQYRREAREALLKSKVCFK